MNKNRTAVKELTTNLRIKLQHLEQRRDQLLEELGSTFNMDQYRKLQFVQNSIECTERRIAGEFKDVRIDFEKRIAT